MDETTHVLERERALERARAAADRSARRLALLQEITAALSAAVEPDDIAEAVRARVGPLVEADAVALLAPGPDGLAAIPPRGAGAELPAWAAPLAREALRGEGGVWLGSPEAGARHPELAAPAIAEGWTACAALPLRARGRAVGALALAFRAPRAFDLEERAFLLSIGEHCAQALDRARLLEAERAQRARAERDRAVLDAVFDAAAARRPGRPSRAGRGEAPLRGGLVPRADGGRDHRRRRDRPRGDGGARAEQFHRNVLGIVGHDLRTPLTTVTTAAYLLDRGGALDPAQRRLVGRIASAGARIEQVIAILVDYAQASGGRGIPIGPRPCDASAICREVADEAEGAHPRREVRCAGEGDASGEWDADRVRQALANLVSNALEHGAPDAPVRVRWRGDGEHVEIEVANAGPPIPPDLLPRIFDAFRGGKRDRPRRGSGLGLGLFIARAILAAHGGRIEVRSGDGETAFTLRLPRRHGPRAPA